MKRNTLGCKARQAYALRMYDSAYPLTTPAQEKCDGVGGQSIRDQCVAMAEPGPGMTAQLLDMRWVFCDKVLSTSGAVGLSQMLPHTGI